MEWVSALRTWLVGPNFDAIAEDIAAQKRNDVWQRIQHRVGEMALAEARGYVRIKAKHIVSRAVEQRIQLDPAVDSHDAKHLQHLAMDAVLRQAVIDIMRMRQPVETAPAASYRRAA